MSQLRSLLSKAKSPVLLPRVGGGGGGRRALSSEDVSNHPNRKDVSELPDEVFVPLVLGLFSVAFAGGYTLAYLGYPRHWSGY